MRIASAPEAAASTLFRYQLDVIAASASDVVRAAGGWLFDRAMAGWDVNLLIADPSDSGRFAFSASAPVLWAV